jgi:hypothetical protein
MLAPFEHRGRFLVQLGKAARPVLIEDPVGNCDLHGAARLRRMGAIIETAVRGEGFDICAVVTETTLIGQPTARLVVSFVRRHALFASLTSD